MEHHQRIFLLHGLLNSIVSVRVEGAERIPEKGGVLLVCNHSDLIDPLLQGLYSGRNLSYLAKAELIDGNPLRRFQRFVDRARRTGVPALVVSILTEILELFGQMLRDAKILPIIRAYRSGRAATSMEYYNEVISNVVQLLNEGEAVAMYPEGGRSYDGKLKPFRGLAARIALQAQVPVVPCALVGAHGFSDLNRWVSGRRSSQRSIIYRIGAAIQPGANPDKADADKAAASAPARSAARSGEKERIKSLTLELQTAVADLLQQRPARPLRAERRPRTQAQNSRDTRTETSRQPELFKASQPDTNTAEAASDSNAGSAAQATAQPAAKSAAKSRATASKGRAGTKPAGKSGRRRKRKSAR